MQFAPSQLQVGTERENPPHTRVLVNFSTVSVPQISSCRKTPYRSLSLKKANRWRKFARRPVAVEKGTRVVLLLSFSIFGERTFNNLQRRFLAEAPSKRVFQQARLFSTVILPVVNVPLPHLPTASGFIAQVGQHESEAAPRTIHARGTETKAQKTYWHASAVGDANAEHDIYDDDAICDYVSIRSTHRARHAGASNGSAKYCVSRATWSPVNSMMLTV
jgi:hypothetical protein